MRRFAFLPFLLLLSACAALPGFWSATGADTAVDGWRTLAPGLEWRSLLANGNAWTQLQIMRLDPTRYRFRVHYRPGEPLNLEGWMAALPDAIAIVNANFFDKQYRAQGLVISDGLAHGRAYRDRGGSLVVTDDRTKVRATRTKPYHASESARQLIQGFPLLVDAGEAAYRGGSHNRSRRTVIAQDQRGHPLIIVSPNYAWSLRDLSAFLAASDLEIETAVNLDGGGSTMLFVDAADYALQSFDAVPTVLAVYGA